MPLPSEIPSNGPRTKVERAKLLLDEFVAAVQAFTAANPPSIRQAKGMGFAVVHVRSAAAPPLHLSAIAGDVVHNARSALDLLASALVLREGGKLDGVAFPVSSTPEKFAGAMQKLRRISPKAKRFLRRLRPYENANLTLLRELSNQDKHRLLVPITLRPRVVRVRNPADGEFYGMRLPDGGEVLDGMEFAIVLQDENAKFFNDATERQIFVELGFAGIDGAENVPARRLLSNVIAHVDRIVSIAEKRLY